MLVEPSTPVSLDVRDGPSATAPHRYGGKLPITLLPLIRSILSHTDGQRYANGAAEVRFLNKLGLQFTVICSTLVDSLNLRSSNAAYRLATYARTSSYVPEENSVRLCEAPHQGKQRL